MKPDNAERYINEAEITKPRKWKEPTEEEKRIRQEAADKAYFESLRHKFKGANDG